MRTMRRRKRTKRRRGFLPFRRFCPWRRAAGLLSGRAAGLIAQRQPFRLQPSRFLQPLVRPQELDSRAAMASQFLALLACVPFCMPAAAIGTFMTACMAKKGKAKAQPNQPCLDHGELNRMLSSLRYQASDKAVDQDKKKAAKLAQDKWNSLVNQGDKKRFLQMWEDSGRGKGVDGLKFAVHFQQSVEQAQEDEFSSRDKYLIPAQILKEKGYSFQDFDTRKEALEFAIELYEENAKEFDTKEENPPSIHETNAELSRYFFVADEGHRKSWKQTQSKKISGGTEVKNGQQLLSVCSDMAPSALPSSASSTMAEVKTEDPAMVEVKKAAKILKTEGGELTCAPLSPFRRPLRQSSLVPGGRGAAGAGSGLGALVVSRPMHPRTDLGGLQKIQTNLRECKSQLAAKSRAAKEENKRKLWSDYATELESSINVLGNFADDCYCQIAVAEDANSMDTKELPALEKKLCHAREMLEHHLTGSKACKRKYSELLEHV